MIIKNPKGTKNPSPEKMREHTFVCKNCGITFIHLNSATCKYCSHKCASEYRKDSGWRLSEKALRVISEKNTGRVKSLEERNRSRVLTVEETKEWLMKNYFDRGLTINGCAKELGCSPTTVSRYLKECDLHGVRTNYESQTLNSGNTGDYRDKDWLYQKYIVEKISSTDIAKMCNAGKTTIKRWLKRHCINVRSNSEAHEGIRRSAESCMKQSKRVSGKNNPFYGKSHKAESIKLMMDKKMHYPYQGGIVKWYKHTRNDGKCIKLQGTWELETARFLDNSSEIYLVHGEFDGFVYKVNSKTRMYYPDFYLPKYDVYLEVKGFFNNKMKRKIEAVISIYGVRIEVWKEGDLLELGILPKKYKGLVAEGYYEKYLVK